MTSFCILEPWRKQMTVVVCIPQWLITIYWNGQLTSGRTRLGCGSSRCYSASIKAVSSRNSHLIIIIWLLIVGGVAFLNETWQVFSFSIVTVNMATATLTNKIHYIWDTQVTSARLVSVPFLLICCLLWIWNKLINFMNTFVLHQCMD